MPDAKQLARIHRVRTLQLGLARVDEARARDTFASEAALSNRIAQLAAAIAPAVAPSADSGGAFSLAAAAHYREKLQHSAFAAEARVAAASQQADRATDATREARRDQSAVEKLIARADADAAVKAIRAMEAAPTFRKVRHDPC